VVIEKYMSVDLSVVILFEILLNVFIENIVEPLSVDYPR